MARPDRVVRQHLRTRFLLTTKSGQTLDAVLMDADPSTLRLVDVESIDAGGVRTKVAGEVFLPRNELAYMQKT